MTALKSSRSAEARRRLRDAAVGLLGLLLLRPALALDLGTEALQVHGFATQGYVHTSDNSFFGDSEDGSFEFTELGINLSYKATPDLLLSGQLLSRRAGEMYDGAPTVDFALIDWNISSSTQHSIGVMAGRVKNALGLYNDTRDVAFTRPSIFLPQEIYFDRVRNLVLASDGAVLYGNLFTDHGNWSVRLGLGRTPIDENVEYTFLGGDFGGDMDADGLSLIGRAEYETPDGRWRLALSAANTDLDYKRGPFDPIGSGHIELLYWIASAQYNAERWSLTAEYMQEPVEFKDFGPLVDNRDGTVQGYYLQASYLIRNDLELIARYAEGYADKDDRDGTGASAQTYGLVPPHGFYQKDWMIGLRWDVTPNFMLRAEYQRNAGTWTLSNRENPVPAETEKDWDMFSVLGSYRF